MRVLVTGAAGFIGAHVTRRFVQRGARVTALVRPGSDLARIADVRSSLDIVEADLFAEANLNELVAAQSPDVCVHLAWHVPPGRYLHAVSNLDSMTASLRLLRALTQTACRRVTLAGTCAEYARRNECVDETAEIRPDTLYGASKHAVSLVASQLARDHGWTVATARLFHVYGPGEHPDRLVPSVVRALLDGRAYPLTSGDQVRDVLYVEDAADALVTVASTGVAGAVNVASGTPATVAEIAREIGRQLDRIDLVQADPLPGRAGGSQWPCAKPGRLHHELRWRPRYDLATGVASTIEWWRERMNHAGGMSPVSQRSN